MKNDINEIETINFEMEMNDKTYRKMQTEFEALKDDVLFTETFSDNEKESELDRLYFYRRVLSVMANDDIPDRAIIGLFCVKDILFKLYADKEQFIGDSDRDTDIFEYVIEYGYRQYDSLDEEVIYTFIEKLAEYYETYGEDDDE